MEKEKRGKKILQVLKHNLLSVFIIIMIVSLASVWAGNVIIKEGAVETGNFNASNVLFVDGANSRVGIGTASPGAKLHIVGAGNEFKISRPGQTDRGIFLDGSDNWFFTDWDTATKGFSINSVGDLTFSSTTASTSTTTGALTVAGGLGVAGAVYAGSSGYFAGNSSFGMGTFPVQLSTRVNANSESMVLGTPSGGLFVSSANELYGLLAGVGNSGNAWLQAGRIDGTATAYNLLLNPSGGNVGIGTATPGSKLTVIGDINFTGSLIGSYSAGNGNITGDLNVTGYTQLGSDAPKIKMKKLMNTTASTEGGQVSFSHGLDSTKIISVTVLVEYTSGMYISMGWTGAGYQFEWRVTDTAVYVLNHATSSENILSKPIKVLIMYEE